MTDRERAMTALRRSPQDAWTLVGGASDPWSRWIRGVILLARGDLREAFAVLTDLALDPVGEVAGLAAARIGSALRQIDEHAGAVAWDEQACRHPGQAATDGWIGRAADDVGLGRPEDAAASLRHAQPHASGWRDPIRIDWVRTEIALMRDDSGTAEAAAARALRNAEAAEAPRHIVKSRLFLGAVRRQHDPDRAVPLLRQALAGAQTMRLRPLLWPIVVVLGDAADPADNDAAADAVRHIAAHLPDGFGDAWRIRPDIGSWLC